MNLRKATSEDWRILLDWRNDPVTLKNFLDRKEISEQTYKLWFNDSLLNSRREIHILEDNSIPVGTIMSDNKDNDLYHISFIVSPDHRNKGYGNKILDIFLNKRKGKFLIEINSDNKPSIKIVKNNGFKFLPSDINQGDEEYLLFFKNQNKSDLDIINEIGKIREKNDVWVDILQIAFTHSPNQTREVFKKVTDDNDLINELFKQLVNNG
jgi:RimJ/RimL family protein N-acetyltransferase